MSNTPLDLLYAETHEWVRVDENGIGYVGISDYAQEQLGDIVYVELPDVGTEVVQGEETAVVESVKAASDIYSPVSGTVVEINEALTDNPEVVNEDVYGRGWFFAIQLFDPDATDHLLNAEDYEAICLDEQSE